MTLAERLAADVLVVGAGAAGLRAALAASETGATVLVVTQRPVPLGGVSASSVGACAALPDGDDSPGDHAEDTIAGGHGLSDRRVVDRFASEAARRMLDLEPLGVAFDRTSHGPLVQHTLPGHRRARSLTVGMRTGVTVLDALHAALLARPSVQFLVGLMVGELHTSDGVVNGALAVHESGFVTIDAGAVVLATGGIHATYGSMAFPAPDLIGDGLSLALRAGAKLVDLEFVQYFPTAMVWPPALAGVIWVGELRYRCGARLTNKHGERFMERHDAIHVELATRDLVSRAIALEVVEGRGSPHGGVWLSAAHASADSVQSFLDESFPGDLFQADYLAAAGIDIRTDSLEVAPVVHFHMGGVMIDPEARTSVPGLFAAGEVAAGVHGANRIENNALTETQVFGVIAGEGAAEFARDARTRWRNDDMPRLVAGNPERCAAVMSEVQRIMGEQVGLLRHATGLSDAVATLHALRSDADWHVPAVSPVGVRAAWRAQNVALASEALALAAHVRTESRGAHYRLDHPDQDDTRWLAHIVVSLSDDELVLTEEPVA